MQPPAIGDLDADYAPCYIRLARQIREEIKHGTYPPGAFLPSSRQLAVQHRVSLTTAIHSLEVLKASGYVRYIAGKPFMVI